VPYCFYRFGWSWSQVFLFIISCGLTELSITAGYHRLFAHRTYETNWWVKLAYLLVGAGAFQASALKWATDHRRHHRFVDKEEDPYNIKKGFFWAHMGWLFVKDNPKYRDQFPGDLSKDPLIAWQHRYYIPIAVATGFGVPTLAGWILGNAFGGLGRDRLWPLWPPDACTHLKTHEAELPYPEPPRSDRLRRQW
jgi:stearoyl-CoA desaturase (delta-9 desaturase)